MIDAVRSLYDYNAWANVRLLDAAEHLTAEQLRQPGTAGHGSVRDTLAHLIRAHKGWLAWWDGSLSTEEAYGLRLTQTDLPDVAAVRAAWSDADDATRKFLAGLGETDLQRVYSTPLPDGSVFRLPLWQMMLHVANHGTQHRSEIAAMLTDFGRSPGGLDLLDYFEPFRT